ncbi:DMT family transporter [Dongia sp.]|uniref:DMT family transporter n=1 Tax=Dongia sp. TaxID=1977262 RepID=UPI003753C8B8
MRAAINLMVLAVILSGIGPVLVRGSPVDPAATAFWRLAIALPIALFFIRRSVLLPPRAMAWAAFAGLSLAGDLCFWNEALVRTTILEGTILVMVYPLIAAIANYLIFKERITKRVAIGGLIAFGGLLLMVADADSSGGSSVEGDLMAVAAAFFYTGSLLISARLCRIYDTQIVSFWLIFWAAVGAAVVSFWPVVADLLGVMPMAPDTRGVPEDLRGWGYVIGYAVLTLVSYNLFNRGLKVVSTGLASLMGYGQPVVATILGYFLLDETPTLDGILGSVVIVIGLVLATRQPKEKPQEKPLEKPLAPAD